MFAGLANRPSTGMAFRDSLVKMSGSTAVGRPLSFIDIATGGWFGEGTLLKAERRKYDIVALRDSRLILMPIDLFERPVHGRGIRCGNDFRDARQHRCGGSRDGDLGKRRGQGRQNDSAFDHRGRNRSAEESQGIGICAPADRGLLL